MLMNVEQMEPRVTWKRHVEVSVQLHESFPKGPIYPRNLMIRHMIAKGQIAGVSCSSWMPKILLRRKVTNLPPA